MRLPPVLESHWGYLESETHQESRHFQGIIRENEASVPDTPGTLDFVVHISRISFGS